MRIYRILERTILPCVERFFKSPNHLTLLGAAIAVIVPLGFYISPVLGFIFIILSGFCDMMDGVMAKARNMETRFGAFLDSSLDRVSDLFYLIGFWIMSWKTGWEKSITLFFLVACILTFMISYTKARVESLGCKIETGIMERTVRIIYILIWALLIIIFNDISETILWIGLTVYCLLTLVTVLQRFLEARSKLSEVRQI